MPEQHIPTAPTSVAAAAARTALARRCGAVVEARWFAGTVFVLILANAALLGVETYSGLVAEWRHWLRLAEHLCLVAFTAEIALRLGAHADRPRDFLKDPWNLFDLAVVVCAFLPVVRENTTVLRLLRLSRVLRTARFLPQLRIVLVAVVRSLPGTLSFLLVGALLLYVYAMVGWVFFGTHDPGRYGSVGRAVLTLFLLMTLDGIGDAVHSGLDISRWSLLYYGSYVLLASFVLVNVLIGVVITSLDEAREMDRDASSAAERTAPGAPDEERHRAALLSRVEAARRALAEVEVELERGVAGRSGPVGQGPVESSGPEPRVRA
ncbi:ion transporter [Streptomyces sp. CRN 30]|uniref:ion transporter n=1 Tax=Streptomyces sp. CRN 30 TaxID=3075613 RepID=UPI002A822842|nr:ion transporter [Streptomyces sp. CRN 30]